MGKIGHAIMQFSLILLAFAGGWAGYSYINKASDHSGAGFSWILGIVLVTIAAVVIGIFLNMVLHEAGHLGMGLLTGYGFVYFNVLSLTIIKQNEKLMIKKYRVAGTAGGCALLPPDIKNGRYAYKLYISGGLLVNFLISVICFLLFLQLAGSADLWARALLVIGIIAAFFGLINLIPSNISMPSDGWVLFNLGREKNSAMRRGMWSSSRVQAFVAGGIRPRDISKELFDWADVSDIGDMFAFVAVFNHYTYLLDSFELLKARELVRTLSENLQNVPDVYKMQCYCELLFHELIGECRNEEVSRLYTKELKDYIKAACSEINVQRLLYAYACLVLKDEAKSKDCLEMFHKACTMPFQAGLVPGEKALISHINKITGKHTDD
jgi:hypothetical protein